MKRGVWTEPAAMHQRFAIVFPTRLAIVGAVAGLGLAAASLASAAEEPFKVELNAIENTSGKCRLSFVVENGSAVAIDSLKLDLAIFGKDGAISLRLLTEMAPIRAKKTVVRSFDVDSECSAIGSVLINDITACAPAALGDCLDRLSLSSRLPNLRFFK
jgi:hypothetical protein